MKFYKDPDNKVFAYDSEADRIKFGKPDLVEITESEALALANPAPTPEQLAAQIRSERDAKLLACDWTQVADAPVDQAAWATYRQALRDITDQPGFPETVEWPTQP